MAHLDLAKKKKIFVAGSGDELDEARRRIATLARRAQIRLQKTCKMEMRKKVPKKIFRAMIRLCNHYFHKSLHKNHAH